MPRIDNPKDMSEGELYYRVCGYGTQPQPFRLIVKGVERLAVALPRDEGIRQWIGACFEPNNYWCWEDLFQRGGCFVHTFYDFDAYLACQSHPVGPNGWVDDWM